MFPLRATRAPAIWLLAEEDRLVPTRVCVPIIESLRAEGHRYSVRTYAARGHDWAGTSVYWADVAAWLASEGLPCIVSANGRPRALDTLAFGLVRLQYRRCAARSAAWRIDCTAATYAVFADGVVGGWQ
jgi:dienelactone hydrolase